MMTLIDTLAQYPVKTIEVDGQVQAYREAGHGQALILFMVSAQVLLHGSISLLYSVIIFM